VKVASSFEHQRCDYLQARRRPANHRRTDQFEERKFGTGEVYTGSLRRSDSIRNSSNAGPKSRNMVAQKSELRPQIRSRPCGQGRQPGTEFLDAETGRQKPQPKCANAPRDQNPGIDWPEMPAETPYLTSCRKRAVCGDWMVGAPGLEPGTR
jgi:hypothetical protein